MSVLDNLPIATIVTLVGIVGAIIALANGSIEFQEFMTSIGVLSGGAGVLGYARAQSGKGVSK